MITTKANKRFFVPALLALITLWLRLANLGYSDYQGDEIKALVILSPGQTILEFLFEQRRGPFQYLVTYLVAHLQPAYSNELLTRLPFALAGASSVLVFYYLTRFHWGPRVAGFAAGLLAVNGLFIGLNRIAQYQSFVILFSLLVLLFFSLALKQPAHARTYHLAGFCSWLLASFSHYDGLFITPLAIYLLARGVRQDSQHSLASRIRWLVFLLGAGAVLLAGFYLPMLAQPGEGTRAYWASRLVDPESPVNPASSLATFHLYNPLLALYLYPLLMALSLARFKQMLPIWLWFLFPWFVLEVVVYDPGTHIYNYLIPGALLAGVGIDVFEQFLGHFIGSRRGTELTTALAAVGLVFFGSLGHFLFVDHTPEYPWEDRRFLLWKLSASETDKKLWVYGFPYNRAWEDIRAYIAAQPNNGYFATNENKAIAWYYLPMDFDIDRAGYYIYIPHPQSFRDPYTKDKIRYWVKHYPPVKVFENQGRVVAEIYLMPEGNLEQIRADGY